MFTNVVVAARVYSVTQMSKYIENLGRQICFPGNDGYLYCNYVITKAGKVISGNGKFLRFLPNNKKRTLLKKEEFSLNTGNQ